MGAQIPNFIWAQAGSSSAPGNSLALLVPRRWYSTLSLSSPDAIPGFRPLWAFVAALGFLLLLSVVIQGPRRAFGQALDLRGLIALTTRSVQRLRRSTRCLAALIAFTVLSWTAGQGLEFRQIQGKEDLLILSKSRGYLELAIEQGMHCALTAFRDVAGLGDNLALIAVMGFLLFKAATDPWDGYVRTPLAIGQVDRQTRRTSPRLTRNLILSVCVVLYGIYRLLSRVMLTSGLPIGGCFAPELVLIPGLMLVTDGMLLAWILAELRDAESVAGLESRKLGNVASVIELCPATMLACFLLLPARYVATLVLLLLLGHLPAWVMTTGFGGYLRWQLGPGLVYLQAVGLVFAGIVGVVAWSRGTLRSLAPGWLSLVRAEGGHMVSILAMVGVAASLFAAMPYLILLLLPVQTWTLAAADSYSHYLTLPVGLIGLASLVELGRSAIPYAHVDSSSEPENRGDDAEPKPHSATELDPNLAI